MPLRRVSCVDINSTDCCFSLDLSLGLLSLLQLVLRTVILIVFGSEGGGDFAVEGGEFGFELFQLVFLAPCLGNDGFKLGDVGFESGGSFLILGDDAGYLLQSVDEVHAGGVSVAHRYYAVVVLVFQVAFNYKAVLHTLVTVNHRRLGYDGNRESVNLTDTLVASVGVAIYDDRIEIENAGMLPEDIPATQLTYGSHILDSHTSEPPNETIARVMYYSGVIEHWGRGLSLIFEECERAGLQQPKVTDERGVVRVTFSRPNLSGHRNDPINDPINLLSDVEKNVLQIVKEHPGISRINIIPIVGKSEATVKRALKSLGEMGFVEYRGSNKTGGYFSL